MRKIFFYSLVFFISSFLMTSDVLAGDGGEIICGGSCKSACSGDETIDTLGSDVCEDPTPVCCISATSTPTPPATPLTCPTGFTLKSGVCFPGTESGIGLSDTPVFFVISTVLNWLLGILGVLGVLAFVISGTQYLVSAGDEDLAKTAKRNMTYAIIGLAIALTGLIVVNAIAGLTGAGEVLYY